MTTEELEKLEALAAKATQRPWSIESDGVYGPPGSLRPPVGGSPWTRACIVMFSSSQSQQSKDTTAFEVALVNAFPALLALAKSGVKWKEALKGLRLAALDDPASEWIVRGVDKALAGEEANDHG